MSLKIQFPEARKKKLVVTDTMVEMINRTLAVHVLGALVVWSGQSRVGKTTTARYLVELINQRFDENAPESFRAIYFEVGEIRKHSGNEMKKGIRSLYQAALHCRIDEGFYLRNPPEVIAAEVVFGLRRKRIQLIIVDEAGCLSVDAIRGMTLVRDIAENQDYTLTIVFVGMDNLPQNMKFLPQIYRRVREWCYFSSYSLDETWSLLKDLHPHFARMDGSKAAHRQQVEVVHESCFGLPGLIVPFVQQLSYRLTTYKGEVDAKFLKAVFELTNKSMIAALTEAKQPYQPYRTTQTGKKRGAKSEASNIEPKKKRGRPSRGNVVPLKPRK